MLRPLFWTQSWDKKIIHSVSNNIWKILSYHSKKTQKHELADEWNAWAFDFRLSIELARLQLSSIEAVCST